MKESQGTNCSAKTDSVIIFREALRDEQKKKREGTMAKTEERRWSVPTKRAKSYADERKAKVHQHGKKEGKELTDYEAGLRSGYLQCQSDHAGLYKYKKALSEGKSKSEAKKISREIGKQKGSKK